MRATMGATRRAGRISPPPPPWGAERLGSWEGEKGDDGGLTALSWVPQMAKRAKPYTVSSRVLMSTVLRSAFLSFPSWNPWPSRTTACGSPSWLKTART